MSRLPASGPILLSVPVVSGVSVPGASSTSLVQWRWPRDYRIGSFVFVLRSGLDTELAQTRLRMLDDDASELSVDGQGLTVSMAGLALRGIPGLQSTFGGRMQAFQRQVRAGDKWSFQIINDNAGAIVPFLGFQVET